MKNKFYKLSVTIALIFISANCAFAEVAETAPTLKFMITKFLIAMIGVAVFSFVLFLGLSIYNKFFVDAQIKDFNLRQHSLQTPRDKEEAIMSFITKSRLR